MSGQSSKGIIALLQESDPQILHFALSRLCTVVDEFWYELAGHLAVVEELSEDDSLPEVTRQQAALLASRAYFHLDASDDSVKFSLRAGQLFNDACVTRSEYTQTILGRCIDLYVAHQESTAEAQENGTTPSAEALDPKLEKTFEALADTWIAADSHFINAKDLVGFSMRARRIDLLDKILRAQVAATKSASLLNFCFEAANSYIRDIVFRTEVLRCLQKLQTAGLGGVDYFAQAQCHLFLQDVTAVSELIHRLLKEDRISAHQICFDLFEGANADFLVQVVAELKKLAAPEGATVGEVDTDVDQILSGRITTQLQLKFLYTNCKADVHILNHIKKVVPTRQAVMQTATVISSSFMYAGTTVDGFLRDNLQWLGQVNNWAKFISTATVGVIHRGHFEEGMNILKPYLPSGSSLPALPFAESGALYGLGLINSGLGAGTAQAKDAVEYLRNALRTYSTNQHMIHGASLGLGLAAMGLHDEEIFDALFVCVNGTDAVPGEGAALSIGLLMMGSDDRNKVDMLITSAREHDQKEKVIRGLVMAIALMMLSKESLAQSLVDDLVQDRDPWVRVGGCWTLGLAFAGTNNSRAIQSLLKVCVKDVSDEVRRAAIMMIGFVCLTDPEHCVELTRVFADSYNPHIRYGVAMALAVSAAGTGNSKAVEMLWVLKEDTTDFVRQGAFIALSMVLMQQTEHTNVRVKELRTLLHQKVGDNKCDGCTRFGVILASGIIDAGGRSATLSLHKNRLVSKKGVVGVFLFMQYWYWFPYVLMISLSFQPTCFIGLNDKLDMPHYKLKSCAPASRYLVPVSILAEKKEKKEQTKAAVLSTTSKEAEKKAKKKAAAGLSESGKTTSAAEKEEEKEKEEVKEEEKPFQVLENPARITANQLKLINHELDERYQPIKTNPGLGVCMLRDTKPDQEVNLVAVNVKERADDVPPPEAFEWP